MMRKFYMLILFVCIGTSAMAQNKVLTVDLAQDSVDITTGFNGAHLTLFGVQDRRGDIVVVISGPRKDMIVRQKERIFGIWTNIRGVKFENVPVYYDYALGNMKMEDTYRDVFEAQEIGLGALRFKAKEDGDIKMFKEALLRNKQAEKRYPVAPQEIEFLNDHFFKTSFYIPSNVPTGNYNIQTFLLRRGAVEEVSMTNVKVGQVGTSARIHGFAQDNALIYGFACVIFALFTGWLSNAIRNKA